MTGLFVFLRRGRLQGIGAIGALWVAAGLFPGAAQAQASPQRIMVAARAATHAGPTIRDLAPVQLYAVPEITLSPPRPLPDMNDEDLKASDPEASNSGASDLPAGAPAAAHRSAGRPMSEALFTPDPILDLSFFSSTAYTAPWYTGDSYGLRVRPRPGRLAAAGGGATWISAASITDTWTLGAQNWRYADSNGLNYTIGNDSSSAPAWGNSARLGGIRIDRSARANAEAQDTWQYSVMVGALSDTSSQAADTALRYGAAASNTVVRYALSPQLKLASQMEWAPGMLTSGFGGEYKTRGLGAWTAGVAKASHEMNEGWRYRVGYQARVLDELRLSWVNEQRSGGFSDLTRYQDFTADAGMSRNQWAATLGMGRWGDLVGRYEVIRAATGPVAQRYGLTQQFWYSPKLRIAFKADRDAASGEYGVALRFSVPIN